VDDGSHVRALKDDPNFLQTNPFGVVVIAERSAVEPKTYVSLQSAL